MSAANPMIDRLEEETHASEPRSEPTLPPESTICPQTRGALDTAENETFDFHDTIPAPPWFDEPFDASDAPADPAR